MEIDGALSKRNNELEREAIAMKETLYYKKTYKSLKYKHIVMLSTSQGTLKK